MSSVISDPWREGLTQKQQKAVEGIALHGKTKVEAARDAGYRNPTSTAYQVFRSPKIQAAVRLASSQMQSELIADAREVKQMWTSIMRDKGETTSDRLSASTLLARADGLFLDQSQTPSSISVTVEYVK